MLCAAQPGRRCGRPARPGRLQSVQVLCLSAQGRNIFKELQKACFFGPISAEPGRKNNYFMGFARRCRPAAAAACCARPGCKLSACSACQPRAGKIASIEKALCAGPNWAHTLSSAAQRKENISCALRRAGWRPSMAVEVLHHAASAWLPLPASGRGHFFACC